MNSPVYSVVANAGQTSVNTKVINNIMMQQQLRAAEYQFVPGLKYGLSRGASERKSYEDTYLVPFYQIYQW